MFGPVTSDRDIVPRRATRKEEKSFLQFVEGCLWSLPYAKHGCTAETVPATDRYPVLPCSHAGVTFCCAFGHQPTLLMLPAKKPGSFTRQAVEVRCSLPVDQYQTMIFTLQNDGVLTYLPAHRFPGWLILFWFRNQTISACRFLYYQLES